MKVSELKDSYAQNKVFAECGIEFTNYLPIIQKKILVDKILQDSLIYDENGMLKCDYTGRKIAIDLGFVLNYTNLELDGESFIDDYDFLEMNDFFLFLQETIGSKENWLIHGLIDNEIEQKLKLDNGIEGVINRALNKILNKIPSDKDLAKLIKSASKEFKNFDPQKMSAIQDMLKVVK